MIFELIETPEAQFEVMRTSTAPPELVILPSASGGVRYFEKMLDALFERNLQALVINPRDCGTSTGPLEDLTFYDFAGDVIHVVEKVTADPVLLVGHAGGNRIARLAARLRPDLFSGLVLLAAGGVASPDPKAAAAMFRMRDPDLSISERRRCIKEAFLAEASEVGADLLYPPDKSSAYATAFLAANAATPVEDWWDGGEGPMLVLQGKEDRIAPPENGHHLRDQYPDRVHVVDLENAGHMIPVERPKETARLIAAFIEDLKTK